VASDVGPGPERGGGESSHRAIVPWLMGADDCADPPVWGGGSPQPRRARSRFPGPLDRPSLN
jgi:hypothetical protein